MTENQDSISQWITISQRVARLIERGDFKLALSDVEAFLAVETNPELRSDAMGYVADFAERLGNVDAAIEELVKARMLTGPCYLKYVHEIRLGKIYRMRGETEHAVNWYRAALVTCSDTQGVSAGSALKGLLAVCNWMDMDTEDRALCIGAAQKSCALLGMADPIHISDSSGSEFNELVGMILEREASGGNKVDRGGKP